MTYMRRSEVAAMAEAWAGTVEGSADAPLLAARFTPAGLLTFLDIAHATGVDVEVIPGRVPIRSDGFPLALPGTGSRCGRHCPAGCEGTTLTHIEAREPSVAPVARS